jgi:hypothetical protein
MPTPFCAVLDELVGFAPQSYNSNPSQLYSVANGGDSPAGELQRFFSLRDITFFAQMTFNFAGAPPPPAYNFACSSDGGGGPMPVNLEPYARLGYGPGGISLGATTEDTDESGLITHGGSVSFGLTWLNWSRGQWKLAPSLYAASSDGLTYMLASLWTLDVLVGGDYQNTFGAPPSFPISLNSGGHTWTYSDFQVGTVDLWAQTLFVYAWFAGTGGDVVYPITQNPFITSFTYEIGVTADDYWQPSDFD